MEYYFFFTILAFLLSMVCGFIVIPSILNFCYSRKLFDIPEARKIHTQAIPRMGGLAFLPSMLLAFVGAVFVAANATGREQFTLNLWTLMFMISLFMIYAVGVVDDIVGLGAKTKFAVQIVAATMLPLSGLYINNLYGFCGITEIPFWLGAPLTVFVIVFIDNAINLIDGIDGLAGGLALMSLFGFLVCFAREGVWSYCVLISGLMGVLVAYLYFNLWGKPERNRKIFMGDTGSLTLGFVLGFLVVKFAMNNTHIMPFRSDSLLLSYTLLIVPCFDVVRVIITRLRDRQPLFKADKRHIHHKLLRCGLSQHKALVVILCFALFFDAINLALYPSVPVTLIVAIDIIIYMGFHLAVDMVIKRKAKNVNTP